jgi:hypothetical protein
VARRISDALASMSPSFWVRGKEPRKLVPQEGRHAACCSGRRADGGRDDGTAELATATARLATNTGTTVSHVLIRRSSRSSSRWRIPDTDDLLPQEVVVR